MSTDNYPELEAQDDMEAGTRALRSGVRRKDVVFIQPQEGADGKPSAPAAHGPSLAEDYLNIVLKGRRSDVKGSNDANAQRPSPSAKSRQDEDFCPICRVAITREERGGVLEKHELSVVHQACLLHSSPPFEGDRTRKAFRNLLSQGWKPDHSPGLGPSNSGIKRPIRVKEKNNTLGLGAMLPQRKCLEQTAKSPERLDAGKARKRQRHDQTRNDRLQEMFYQSDDILRHLHP